MDKNFNESQEFSPCRTSEYFLIFFSFLFPIPHIDYQKLIKIIRAFHHASSKYFDDLSYMCWPFLPGLNSWIYGKILKNDVCLDSHSSVINSRKVASLCLKQTNHGYCSFFLVFLLISFFPPVLLFQFVFFSSPINVEENLRSLEFIRREVNPWRKGRKFRGSQGSRRHMVVFWNYSDHKYVP